MEQSFQTSPSVNGFAGNMVNHVKAFFVRELGKYFILRLSLFAISPSSMRYMATRSTMDSLGSPENLVNLGTFHLEAIPPAECTQIKGTYNLAYGGQRLPHFAP